MERIDDLQVNDLKLIQDTDLFCFGTDAVLLSHFPIIKKNAKVADLGTGSGVLMLLMFARQPKADYYGLEIQPALYELALRNIELNKVENSIHAYLGNIKEARAILGCEFDLAVANPPYEKINEGKPRDNPSHLTARKEAKITFDELASNTYKILKEGGHFCLIHKARRFSEIIFTLKKNKLEPKRMRFIHANIEKPATYVLIDSVKGAKEHSEVLPPLILYDQDGSESAELKNIYGNSHEF